ncbi:MAG: asparaginase [Planctomycetes bacterium]|nr:asparaginase [Planctomycetota bacterium]
MNSTDPEVPPALLYRFRGGDLETVHRGWMTIWEDGRIRSKGDPDVRVFTRSATKPFQALACLVSGAAHRFALTDQELALACSSHNGSKLHRELALGMLAKAGLSENNLQCGSSDPYGKFEQREFIQKGQSASPGIHNCSGKHAAFLLTQIHLGGAPENYLEPDSPLQKLVRELVAKTMSVTEADLGIYVDGCSAPTFRPPLQSLALGFARFANPELGPSALQPHLTRLRDAIVKHPIEHSGRGRLCEAILRSSEGRVIPKNGAEGVYAFGVRGRRSGFAIKVEDGSARGYEPIVVDTLLRHGFVDGSQTVNLMKFADPRVFNAAGRVVGREEIVAQI